MNVCKCNYHLCNKHLNNSFTVFHCRRNDNWKFQKMKDSFNIFLGFFNFDRLFFHLNDCSLHLSFHVIFTILLYYYKRNNYFRYLSTDATIWSILRFNLLLCYHWYLFRWINCQYWIASNLEIYLSNDEPMTIIIETANSHHQISWWMHYNDSHYPKILLFISIAIHF